MNNYTDYGEHISVQEYTNPNTLEKGLLIGHYETGVFLNHSDIMYVFGILFTYIQNNIHNNPPIPNE